MRTAGLILALLLACPASSAQSRTEDPVVSWEINGGAAERAASEAFTTTLLKALASPSRSLDQRLRDKGRMIDVIMAVANPKPGERTLDVGGGGGYIAAILSRLVGDTGHVDIHNTPGWIAQFPGMASEVLMPRLNRPNIGFIETPWNGITGDPDSYDLIVLGQVYHDAVLEGADVLAMNQRFFELLKPGGRIIIEDHDANPLMHIGQQVNLHRISHGDVTGNFLMAGFAEGELALIESTYDDRRFNVFRPGVRGRTDRFVASFVKPRDGKVLRCPTRDPC